MEIQPRIGKRIVLFPIPLQGHLNPMLELANILYSRGFFISIIHTTFNAPNPTNQPNFTFHPIDESLLEGEASLGDVMGLFTVLNVKCVQPFRDCLSGLLSDCDGPDSEPIACLITDAFWHFSQAVADGLGVPRLALRTGNVSSFVVLAYFPFLREKGYLPLKDTKRI